MVNTLCLQIDAPAAGGEFHRVAEQVPDNLLQPLGVGLHGAQIVGNFDADLHAFGLRRGQDCFHRSPRRLRQLHRLHLQTKLAGDDPRRVQKIINQGFLRLGAFGNRLQTFGKLLGIG